METTLDKPHYILEEDLAYCYHNTAFKVHKGTEYVFNGNSFSPKEFNAETNAGWTVSEEFILKSGMFKVKD